MNDELTDSKESDIANAYDHGLQAIQGVKPENPYKETALVLPNGSHVVQFPARKKERPEFLQQTVTFYDINSFIAYVIEFAESATQIFYDTRAYTMTAVIDYHESETKSDANMPRHCDHVALFHARTTETWDTWLKNNDTAMDQIAFAEFIEDNATDFVTPNSADMQAIACGIEAVEGVDFKQSSRLDNGAASIVYEHTIDGRVIGGNLEIPKHIEIAIKPFEGADRFKLSALFRYRISSGSLKLRYKITEHRGVLEHVFKSMGDKVFEATEILPLNGRMS